MKVAPVVPSAPPKPRDEIYKPKGGVRKPYKNVVPLIHSTLTEGAARRFAASSARMFHGDNPEVAVPRMLSQKQMARLQAGVEQRSRAIRAFMKDYFGKGKQKVIPEEVMCGILNRHHLSGISHWIRRKDINHMSGTDVVNGPDGRPKAIEDNPGYVGGPGDALVAKKAALDLIPGLKDVTEDLDPMTFYQSMVDQARKRCKGGEVIMLSYGRGSASDHEEVRLARIMKKLGVDTLSLDAWEHDQRYGRWLEAGRNGVFIRERSGEKTKVGYILSNVESHDLDPHHKSVRDAATWNLASDKIGELETQQKKRGLSPAMVTTLDQLRAMVAGDEQGQVEYKGLRKFYKASFPDDYEAWQYEGVKGLLDAYYNKKVGLSNPPGTDSWIGDKEFYNHVPKLIEHYLGEKPIIENIPSRSFRTFSGKKAVADESVFAGTFAAGAREGLVIKRVDGRGGDAVWVGPKTSEEVWQGLQEQIRRHPALYIVQEYMPLSRVDGMLVDMRLINHVWGKKVQTMPYPWARATPDLEGGDGKVNLSLHGAGGEQAVFVARKPKGVTRKQPAEAVPSLATTRERRDNPDYRPYKLRRV